MVRGRKVWLAKVIWRRRIEMDGGEGNDQGLGQQQDFFLPLLPIVADQEQVQEAVRDAVGEVLDGRVRPETSS